ncbi:hypothetical protein BDA99DRAFT_272408 [Phascolomyces articulosus]|uniref:Uncharacterized protein n=1 Tax=Phascolomyces articulosus TaxID=60185 RepID=A0AAD5PHL9_9FUNG|nr:hypothetical protein BDA99DRAFT_272408 [Phascolomyces articulosus]
MPLTDLSCADVKKKKIKKNMDDRYYLNCYDVPLKKKFYRSYSNIASSTTYTQERQIVEGQFFHCPYKGCTNFQYKLTPLYQHIRKIHDQDFPTLRTAKQYKYIFKNQNDQFILFDENSRNSLNDGEHLFVAYEMWYRDKNPKKEKVTMVYCPFIDCKMRCFTLYTMFQHFEEIHEMELPPAILTVISQPIPSNKSLMLKTIPNGKLIDLFEETKSKNSLKPREQFSIVFSTSLE